MNKPPRTVLIVEDNNVASTIYKKAAEQAIAQLPNPSDYNVVSVPDYKGFREEWAKAHLKKQPLAAIIMDNEYPLDMAANKTAVADRGIESIRELRLLRDKVPVLFASASTPEKLPVLCEKIWAEPPAPSPSATHYVIDENTEALTKGPAGEAKACIEDFLKRHLGKEQVQSLQR